MTFPLRLRSLRAVDVLTIAFVFMLSVFIIFFSRRNEEVMMTIVINIIASLGIVLLASSADKNGILRAIHDWYPVPAIFLVFKEVYIILESLGRTDWDSLLITADHAIFGVNPTQWLQQFTSPPLTEILQIAYASYYFIMLTVGIEIFLSKDKGKFSFVLFTFVYGFFLSYLGYLIFPAVGPRFTLHQFNSLDTELPGIFFTSTIRDVINAGESIPKGAANAFALAQRDAFPSGHTEMTLIVMYLAAKFKLKSRYILYLFGSLLIISTVYLRYHYVVDLLGGAVFMMVTVWTGPKLFNSWEKLSQKQLS